MRGGMVLALAAMATLAGNAAWAAPDRVERGPVTVKSGSKDGKAGFWVSYHQYTLRDFSAEFADLLSYDGRAIALSDVRTTARTRGSEYDNKNVEFGRYINFGAIDRVLGNPSYVGQHGNKKSWIAEYARDTGHGFVIYDRGCTASSLLEAGRLARIYELLALGVVPPQPTMSGAHVAYYQDQRYDIPLTKAAVLAKLQEVFRMGIDTYSPIVLDLNHDGRIGVTGRSTAAIRHKKNAYVAAGSVEFDLRGFGEKKRYEWLSGDGDGFLVYDKDDALSQSAAKGADVDGNVLFGNAVGYDNGFQKLAIYTADVKVAGLDFFGLGGAAARDVAKGEHLRHLKVWVDANRDARPQPEELLTLSSLGITEIGLKPAFVTNKDGEVLIRGTFVQGGERRMMEDVWFAEEPKAATKREVKE
jgi:hypothetical protein